MIVAKTILEQLGGRKFAVITGARNFLADEKALTFSLPGAGGYCKNGINRVKITLTPRDTYTMEFMRVRAGKVNLIAKHDDIFFDMLTSVFRKETGLETRL